MNTDTAVVQQQYVPVFYVLSINVDYSYSSSLDSIDYKALEIEIELQLVELYSLYLNSSSLELKEVEL